MAYFYAKVEGGPFGAPEMKKRLVVGISGATGAIYGIRLLEALREMGVETHLVVTDPAKETILRETPYTLEKVLGLATFHYEIDDFNAPIASGSFRTEGMVVIPCSIKSLSAIANSFNTNLLIRAADVTLKERRPLVLVVRETPLHKGHLELMLKAAELGAVIMPPMPAFYTLPKTLEELIDQFLERLLDLFGLRWKRP